MLKFFRNIFIFFLILILSAGGCIFYAFKIEPFRLKLHEFALTEKQDGTAPYKIVQISDLHIKADFTSDELKKVVDKVNKQEPDLVIFTGDLYDNYAVYHDDENVISELSKITAKYGKIAIWGNRDYGGGASRQYASIMEGSGFTLLKNESLRIALSQNSSILFTGLDDSMLGSPDMPDAPETDAPETDAADYQILLTHEPDVVEKYDTDSYDIILSGHSHGGQINIPFIPKLNEMAVAATALSTKYSGGMYTLSPDSKTRLYVNTGIGTTHISARFGVVPEITVFQIHL